MAELDLKLLKDALLKVSPGPWDMNLVYGILRTAHEVSEPGIFDGDEEDGYAPTYRPYDDAAFIALARTMVPLLIDLVEQQEETLSRYR